MVGRKLSKQQRQRIAGRNSVVGEEATVIACYGKEADVTLDLGSAAMMAPVRCKLRPNIESLVAGDRVRILQAPDSATIEQCLTRRSSLERPDSYGKLRPVAANIDTAFIVIAPRPEPFANLIDRYVLALRLAGVQAQLVLNKEDLLTGNIEAKDRELISLLAMYEQLGIPVLRASSPAATELGTGRKTETGMNELRAALQNQTSVFVGQSGVGKSTLINALCPAAGAKTSALSTAQAKGRHTTTTAKLFALPGGGHIIDSPGIREFRLEHVANDDVVLGFPELETLSLQCKFRNCAHGDEKGCALQRAHKAGDIKSQRWDSYWQIRQSLEQ